MDTKKEQRLYPDTNAVVYRIVTLLELSDEECVDHLKRIRRYEGSDTIIDSAAVRGYTRALTAYLAQGNGPNRSKGETKPSPTLQELRDKFLPEEPKKPNKLPDPPGPE